MEGKVTKAAEVQLGFAFLTGTAPVTLPRGETDTPGPEAPFASPQKSRRPRAGAPPRNLGEVLTVAHALLLEAPLEEVNVQLLALFEFCEAALTRSLDVMPVRTGVPFSDEEYRSLRGIGHAQWLLAEAQGKREATPEPARAKKPKRARSDG
ncbi:MAG: hypothetical protein AB1671_25340 [Thermodesulfobacteriota bacterium]